MLVARAGDEATAGAGGDGERREVEVAAGVAEGVANGARIALCRCCCAATAARSPPAPASSAERLITGLGVAGVAEAEACFCVSPDRPCEVGSLPERDVTESA